MPAACYWRAVSPVSNGKHYKDKDKNRISKVYSKDSSSVESSFIDS